MIRPILPMTTVDEPTKEMTMPDLTGKTVALLLTDGYEDSELTSPWEAVARVIPDEQPQI